MTKWSVISKYFIVRLSINFPIIIKRIDLKFFAILRQRYNEHGKLESDAARRTSTGNIRKSRGANIWRVSRKKKEGKTKIPRFGVAPRAFVASATNLGLGNLQIAKRTGIRIHVDDDGNVNTYTRNDVATHVCNTSALLAAARSERCAPATGYHGIRTYAKMRIHFLQNVSHSAAHYRRNEKGMMHRGNSDKEDPSGASEMEEEKERTYRGRGGREKRGEEGEGIPPLSGEEERNGREGQEGRREKGKPEHFVKQGKMRLRRGTTAAFLSLQNYVFRGPPPYLSKHNKFPLCLPRSSISFLLSTPRSSTSSLLSSVSPRVSATGTRLSSSHTGVVRIRFFVYHMLPLYPSVSVRTSNVHTHARRSTSFRGPIRVHRFPPTNSHPDRSQLPKSSIRGSSA